MMVKEKRKTWQTEKGSTSQPARDVKSTSEATRTTTEGNTLDFALEIQKEEINLIAQVNDQT